MGCGGVENATRIIHWFVEDTVLTGNSGSWVNSAGTELDDSEWIVLDNETYAVVWSFIYMIVLL